jgi:hypothetical protein
MFVENGSVTAGATLTNGGEIYLSSPLAVINSPSVVVTGLVSGTGRVQGGLNVISAGQVRVGVGDRLVVTGASTSNGRIDVTGGEIEFQGALSNNTASPSTGTISARDAVIRFGGGLANAGSLTITGAVTDVYGEINNVASSPTTGRIVVSGGATANFYDDIANAGTIQVSAAGSLASTAVFFGALSGNGVAGGGHVFLEGDARPGFSPGVMAFGGDVSFGPAATLNLELAGLAAGTQYDQVSVADTASLGGTLRVSLIEGFVPPAVGQSFTLLTFASRTGTFDDVFLPSAAAAAGLGWNLTYTPTSVVLTTTALLEGDINLDGRVDRADVALFVGHYGLATGSTWTTGDFNSDGRTSLADLAILQRRLGTTLPPPSPALGSPATVPEPSTLSLVVVAALGLVGWQFPSRRSTQLGK